MEPFPGIPHDALLRLVVLIALLLGTARLFGELMRRIGQAPVVGEILAGVVLGPLLSEAFPNLAEAMLPQTVEQSQLLDAVAFIGIMALIIVVGLETDLALIRARARSAAAVGLGGLVVPFLAGTAIGWLFSDDLLGAETPRVVFSLFLGVALALSAIPVLAKVLGDLGLIRTEFGQTTLAAGMIDDLLGWTLLGLVTALATHGTISLGALATTLGAVALFGAATLWIARPFVRWSLAFVQDRFRVRDRLLTLVVVLAFGWGAFTHALHLEPILGAFAVGIIFGQSRRLPVEVGRQLESVTYGIFAPIFLATAGLRLRLEIFTDAKLLGLTVALLAVAAAGKLAGCYVGARVADVGDREALAYGVALNARGVLGIVVAAIGLSLGIFGVEIYSMIVVTSIVTSLAAPVGLKWLLGTEIEHQAARRASHLDEVRRILLPVRLRDEEPMALRALEFAVLLGLGHRKPAITLMTVVDPSERKVAGERLAELSRLLPPGTNVARRVVTGDPLRAILDEAAEGYDLLALGAPEPGDGADYLFEPIADQLVKLSSCPSLIFAAREGHWPPRRILVPTGGSLASAQAADLACAVAGQTGQVVLLHVIEADAHEPAAVAAQNSLAVRHDIGQSIVDELRRPGLEAGIAVSTEVVFGPTTTSAILDRAGRDIDLLIVGTSLHAGSARLYLGPKVERLLRESTCSIIVYNG